MTVAELLPLLLSGHWSFLLLLLTLQAMKPRWERALIA